MEPLHSPEEMRFLSNLGHWIEGGILGTVAIVALLEALGYLAGDRSRFLWPGFVLLAGVVLLAYMFLHHGLGRVGASWRFVTGDPQQRQHFFMAVLLLVAGAAELVHRMPSASGSVWGFVWPGALLVIGILFTVHTQHGTQAAVTWAARVHRYLGLLLIAGGAARAAQVVGVAKVGWLAFAWPLLLLVSAVLLLAYREPKGAYESSSSQHASGAHGH